MRACVCATDRGQVSHHEEGGERGVEQEGDPLGGAGRDAEAADAGGVSCHGDKVTSYVLHGFKMGSQSNTFLTFPSP